MSAPFLPLGAFFVSAVHVGQPYSPEGRLGCVPHELQRQYAPPYEQCVREKHVSRSGFCGDMLAATLRETGISRTPGACHAVPVALHKE